MTALPRRLLAATFVAFLYLVPVAAVSAQSAPTQHSGAQVYLLRGLLNIFSLGMDSLAEKLKAQGFQPTVSTWESGSLIAESIVKARAAGAQAADHSDRAFARRQHHAGDQPHPWRARHPGRSGGDLRSDCSPASRPPISGASSIFFPRSSQKIEPGPGFKGELDNIDLSADGGITHTNIDKMDRLHQFVIARMLAITGGAPPKAQGRR